MKRIGIYLALLAALWFVPVKGLEIGKLQPVEVVFVYRSEGQIVIETDTADLGFGITLTEALEDLKLTTPGIIYLDTAEYLLLGNNALDTVEQLRPILKKSVQICTADIGIDLQLAARFLPAHGKLPQLKHYHQGLVLPHLTESKKRLKLL